MIVHNGLWLPLPWHLPLSAQGLRVSLAPLGINASGLQRLRRLLSEGEPTRGKVFYRELGSYETSMLPLGS